MGGAPRVFVGAFPLFNADVVPPSKPCWPKWPLLAPCNPYDESAVIDDAPSEEATARDTRSARDRSSVQMDPDRP